ncbi:MAG: TetR/AcrR family transcriptional regulator [Thermoleophilaceae bacterium]
MSERVKSKVKAPRPKRRYDSTRRRDQAAATRRAILDSAQRLFEHGGYAGTSMADVAREAGVALKTVYLAFDTKSGLMRAVWHRALRGDEGDAPVADRTWYRAVLEEPDASRQLARTVENGVLVKRRAGATMRVIQAAAASDPDIAALWARIQTDFHANQRTILESMAEKRALRRGLDVDAAADLMWTLNHPTVYWLLVGERGWSEERYGKWLEAALREQLFGERPLSRPSSRAVPRRRPRR